MQVIVYDFGLDVNAYAALGRDLPRVEPEKCPKCGSRKGFTGEGARRRKVWLSGVVAALVIFVLRLRCKGCTRISTVLPSFLHPLKRYALQDIQSVLVARFLPTEGASAGYLQVERLVGKGKPLNSGPVQSTQRSWCEGFERQARPWLEAMGKWLASRSGATVLGRRVTEGYASGVLSLGLQCLDWFYEVVGLPQGLPEDFLARLWAQGGSEFGLLLLAPTPRCREGP